MPGGGYAEKAAVPRGMLMPVPARLSLAEAAAIPEAWFTAYLNLFLEGSLRPGERLLVHAAASGVGTAAIQLAKRAGCSVVATARSEKKCETLAALGADLVVDTSRQEFLSKIEAKFGKDSVDLVLDSVGGPLFSPNIRSLRRGGRIVLIASMAGPGAEIDLRAVLAKRLRIIGSTLRSRPLDEKIALTKAFVRDVLPGVRGREPRARHRLRVPAPERRRGAPPHGRERERRQDRPPRGLTCRPSRPRHGRSSSISTEPSSTPTRRSTNACRSSSRRSAARR